MHATPDLEHPTPPPGGGVTGLYRLARRISRWPGVHRMIPRGLRRKMVGMLRPASYAHFPDRVYMEQQMLPAIIGLRPGRVLDVGLEDYTKHYADWYPNDCDYWTIDINPRVAQYGRPERHIVGDVRDVKSYFQPASIDVVLMNGPFGYGIDTEVEQAQTIEAVRSLLTPRGWMMIGWDVAPDGLPVVFDGRRPGHVRDPIELDVVRSHFDHVGPGDLPARKTFADCSHVYDWFRARA